MSKHTLRTLTATAAAATTAAVVLTGAPAQAYTVDDRYDNGNTANRVVATVDYLSPTVVDVRFDHVKDLAGDAYCTVVEAELWSSSGGYRKLGSTITIGSVCGGKAASFPVKRISTGDRGGIFEVRVQARKGSGGSWVGFGACRVATDGSENCR